MTRLHVIFALSFLMTGVLLLTGCLGEDYVPNHDIILIKVTPTGTLEWSKVIDTGGDDTARTMIPTSDGGILIQTILTNRWSLMRFSNDGSNVWERDYIESGCLDDAITQLQDGDFVTASSGRGAVCKIGKNGNLIWNKSSVKFDRLEYSQVYSIIETNDGGFLVTGDSQSLFRLDSEGRLLWNYFYGTEGYGNIYPIIELKNGQSFLGVSQKNNQLFAIQLDQSGKIIANYSLGKYDGSPAPSMNVKKNGYSIMFFNTTNAHFESVLLDDKGNITKIQILMNATAHCIPATDGGYFCAGFQSDEGEKRINPFEGEKTKVIVKKLDADGILKWEQPVTTFCKAKALNNIEITGLIQTNDGGYLILGSRDNFWKC
jgi:hypothetical protein